MNRLLKVKEHPGLVRDTLSNGIINVDKQAYLNHKRKKEFLKQMELEEESKENRLNNLEHRMNNLDDKLDQILNILKNVNTNS